MHPRLLLVGDLFLDAARAVPHRMAAALGDEQLTFADVQRQADAMRVVLGRECRPGDRVAVWSATDLRLVPLFAAAAQAGVVFVPIAPQLTEQEAANVAGAARPALLVADDDRLAVASEIAAPLGVAVLPLAALGATEGAKGAGSARREPTPTIDERDPHVIFFTSGSSGRPKGVVLSHRVNVLRSHPGAQFEPRGVAVCAFPLFHMAGWTIALQQWHARDGVVFVPSTSAAVIRDAVGRHRATRLNCVPAVWRRIIDECGAPLDTLRFADTGTSATPPDLLERIAALAPNAQVRVFYGSTEAGNVATLEHADVARKPGRVGVPSVSTEVELGDDGEVRVRSPLLADGYFDDADATAAAFADGWYRTGDRGELDGDGYLSIVGRVGEAIRSGGESVDPTEVEAALRTHPAIADVAVFGVPDADWGEVVAAAVVVEPSAAVPSAPDLASFLAARLARFKHPRVVVAVDVLPRTAATGQLQRALLPDLAVGALEPQGTPAS